MLDVIMVLRKMQTFRLLRWRIENIDDDDRRLVMSWPKLRTLTVLPSDKASTISLSTLRIIAQSCPKLRHLNIQLDISTIPPFDISRKSLAHKLEVLYVGEVHSHYSNIVANPNGTAFGFDFPLSEIYRIGARD